MSVFITGTDTGCGKTIVTSALLRALKRRDLRVVAMKPIATGAVPHGSTLVNDDALTLQRESNVEVPYALINPFVFAPPVAPSFAAAEAGVEIDLETIKQAYDELNGLADVVLVEGVGGWRVPINRGQHLIDLVRYLELRVILVSGLRLGCINHTVLTAEALVHDAVPLIGWIANRVDPDYANVAETIETLSREIPAPLIGTTPQCNPLDLDAVADALEPAARAIVGDGNDAH